MEKLFDVALWLSLGLQEEVRPSFRYLQPAWGKKKVRVRKILLPATTSPIMTAVHFKSVELVDFDKVLGTTSTEVSSVALGGRILACSDEWFAPASDLLKVSSLAQECVNV